MPMCQNKNSDMHRKSMYKYCSSIATGVLPFWSDDWIHWACWDLSNLDHLTYTSKSMRRMPSLKTNVCWCSEHESNAPMRPFYYVPSCPRLRSFSSRDLIECDGTLETFGASCQGIWQQSRFPGTCQQSSRMTSSIESWVSNAIEVDTEKRPQGIRIWWAWYYPFHTE